MSDQKNRVMESMTKMVLGYWNVRVWRTEQQPNLGPNKEISNALGELFMRTRASLSPAQIAMELDKFEEVAAYEILDPAGNGVVVYPDWK